MANSILSSLLGKTTFAAINELTNFQCWTNLQIVDVEIDAESANTDYPLSTTQYSPSGTYVSLTAADIQSIKVIRPTKMRITGICPDISTIESVLTTFANAQFTVAITTKGLTAVSMAVLTVEIEQTPEMLSAARMVIELERATPPVAVTYAPAQAADQPTLGVRLQTLAASATATVTSVYNKVSSAASAIL